MDVEMINDILALYLIQYIVASHYIIMSCFDHRLAVDNSSLRRK